MNAPIDGFYVAPLESREAEQAVLGGLMIDAGLIDVVGDLLTADDFNSVQNGKIWSAINSRIHAAKDCDIITVYEAMKGEVDLTYLTNLAQFRPSAANARRYAEIIRERALSRKLVTVSGEISELAREHAMPFDERIEQASSQLLKLMPERAGAEWTSTTDTVVAFLDHISARADGAPSDAISTGLRDLDEILDGGARPGQLIILAARPSMGKTAMGVNIGMHAALNCNLAVGMFTLEMPKEELVMRQVSGLARIHLTKLRKPKLLNENDWPRMIEAVERLREVRFEVADQSAPTINQIKSKAKKLKRTKGLDLLMIDYIGLASGTNPKENRNQQLGEVSRGLKGLAKELGIPIYCLAQLNREVEKRVSSRPQLADLKDSGDIEQDADVVIFIDRPHQKNPDLGDDWKQYAEINVAKQRNGPTGVLNMRFIGEHTTFCDWDGYKPSTAGRSSKSNL